jgi:integrase
VVRLIASPSLGSRRAGRIDPSYREICEVPSLQGAHRLAQGSCPGRKVVSDPAQPRRRGQGPAPEEMHPLSAEVARRRLDAAKGDRLEAHYVLAVHTSMGRWELLGLKWAEVDLENATVRVCRTLTRTDNGHRLALGESKTRNSRRTVRLTQWAVEALRSHRARQAEEKLRFGGLYQDLVFASEGGGLINLSNLRQRSFAPLLDHAGLPQITFHDLRHICASLLFQRSVHPTFVQELLGHASVAIILDTYSHLLPGMGGEATDALGEVLG